MVDKIDFLRFYQVLKINKMAKWNNTIYDLEEIVGRLEDVCQGIRKVKSPFVVLKLTSARLF